MSTPITWPVSPTCLLARKQSKPPPLPRSRIVFPFFREAIVIGLPQPNPMLKSKGAFNISSREYPFSYKVTC
ncbi:MAG: hypothetical protein PHV53_00045 [Fermentimonas sp.]|nr:hypothetical protein [Fermentimonas sp.]